MPGRSERRGAGKGSGGENHMFPGMLGFVVGERWEACCQRHEIRLGGWRRTEQFSGLFMLHMREQGSNSHGKGNLLRELTRYLVICLIP